MSPFSKSDRKHSDDQVNDCVVDANDNVTISVTVPTLYEEPAAHNVASGNRNVDARVIC